MGLFDNYQFAGYGGQGGGLLDIFRMMQSVPMQQPQGFPQEQAALPPQAQPAQQMPPPQMAPQMPQGPGIGDRMMAGFQGLANAGSPMQALGNLVGGLATGQRSDPVGMYQQQANQTEKALVGYGFNPNLARVVAGNPDLMKAVLPHVMGIGGQTDDIKEYQFAKREDPSLTFERFMARKKSVTGEYGMQPIYGTNEKGETVVLQLGKSGDAKQSVLPAGVKLSTGVDKIDLGTHWGIIDKKTGNMVGQQKKDIAGKEAEEEIGKDRGIASAALAPAEMAAKRSIEKIDQFINSPGFSEVFGAIDQFRPNWTMSNAGRESLSRFKQLSGEAFLEGRQLLKGGGAITDFESNKAEAAIARLERSLSESDAKLALADFKDAVRAGVEKLRTRAGQQPASGVAAPAAPQRIRLNADGTIKQ